MEYGETERVLCSWVLTNQCDKPKSKQTVKSKIKTIFKDRVPPVAENPGEVSCDNPHQKKLPGLAL